MKRLGKGLLMSLGMFTAIPLPRLIWEEAGMNLVISFLPVDGLVIGALWYGLARLMTAVPLPPLLKSTAFLLCPYLLSGFLHADGFMDTADAVFSRRDLAERRRILKDSHTGAFAVIAFNVLLLTGFSAVHTLVTAERDMLPLLWIPALSRSCVALALLNLKPMSDTGYLAMYRKNTAFRHSILPVLCICLCFAGAFAARDFAGLYPLLALVLSAGLATLYVYRQMDGLSGDLCGCVITVSELCALLCMAVLAV